MPRNPYACCGTVRDLCKSHLKCSKTRHGGYTVQGRKLVQYCALRNELVLPSTCALTDFHVDTEYPVCRYFHNSLREFFSDDKVLEKNIQVEDTGRKLGKKKIFFFKAINNKENPVKKRKMGPKNNQTDDNVEENVGNILMQEKKIKKKEAIKKNFYQM